MPKKLGLNKHQKAAHKKGERQIGREQIDEMLELSLSTNPDDRLVAAENLCPCHVRTRIAVVWDALYRMMEDPCANVRHAAWHTIEDGGKPADEEGMLRIERICDAEADPRVRRFAEEILVNIGVDRLARQSTADRAAVIRVPRKRGKCDFCGRTEVFVEMDLETMIPSGDYPRASLICEACMSAR